MRMVGKMHKKSLEKWKGKKEWEKTSIESENSGKEE